MVTATPTLYTVDEAAHLLRVSKRTAQSMIASGALAAVRISPRIVRVSADAILAAQQPYTPPRDVDTRARQVAR